MKTPPTAGRMELRISEEEKAMMDQLLAAMPVLKYRSDLVKFWLYREYVLMGRPAKLAPRTAQGSAELRKNAGRGTG